MVTLGIQIVNDKLPTGKIVIRIIKADKFSVYSTPNISISREEVFDLAAYGHDYADHIESYFLDEEWFELKPDEIKKIKGIPKLDDWISEKRNNKIDDILRN
jgi:hypothetical protein